MRNQERGSRATALTLLSAFVLIAIIFHSLGCSGKQPDAWGARNIGWAASGPGGEPLPGVDSASVDFGIWGDGAAIAIWSDANSTSLGGSGMGGRELEPGETRRGVKYEGHLLGRKGQDVALSCYTPDGTIGKVAIGKRNFDLAQGGLFLVSTCGAEVLVMQLPLARLDLKPAGKRTMEDLSADLLRSTARSDTDISAFFRKGSKAE